MQQLRDKLTIAERAAKSEAQLKVMISFYSPCCKLYCMFLLLLKLKLFFVPTGKISYTTQSPRGEFERIA